MVGVGGKKGGGMLFLFGAFRGSEEQPRGQSKTQPQWTERHRKTAVNRSLPRSRVF